MGSRRDWRSVTKVIAHFLKPFWVKQDLVIYVLAVDWLKKHRARMGDGLELQKSCPFNRALRVEGDSVYITEVASFGVRRTRDLHLRPHLCCFWTD